MNDSIFDRFRLTAMERNLGVYGIKVYTKNDGEASFRWRSDDQVCLYSGSKTFASIGVGICMDEGRLRLTDRVLDFFPEYKSLAFPESDKITIRDLLHMSSGKLSFLFSDEAAMRDTDWAELFFKEKVSCKPGERFFYSNACTYMLGRVIEKLSGLKLRDYLVPRLFDKLGIDNPQWHECPGGHTIAASGLYLTTDEFARLGETLLHKGTYKGRQIVSEEYVNRMSTDVVECGFGDGTDPESAAGYGYQVWRCTKPGVYRADGMYGQFSIVFPDEEAVVTVTSHNERHANDIIRAVFTDILPRLS